MLNGFLDTAKNSISPSDAFIRLRIGSGIVILPPEITSCGKVIISSIYIHCTGVYIKVSTTRYFIGHHLAISHPRSWRLLSFIQLQRLPNRISFHRNRIEIASPNRLLLSFSSQNRFFRQKRTRYRVYTPNQKTVYIFTYFTLYRLNVKSLYLSVVYKIYLLIVILYAILWRFCRDFVAILMR